MSIGPGLDDLQRAHFPMGGEPLVALDLTDTLITVTDPPTDLLDAPGRTEAWWQLQATRLPDGPVPDAAAARRLRAAIRDLLDAHLERRPPAPTSIEDVNAATAAAPASLRLGPGLTAETRWHTEFGGNPALAAIAREAIELLTTPERLKRLRRCASPVCSMLFLAENPRRQWCAANTCGNRARVARHYERTHGKSVRTTEE
jgi:predicted RNA-binding Zn ribbon-like protein